jgi:hypothetical protein
MIRAGSLKCRAVMAFCLTPEQMESRLGRDKCSSETTEIIRALIEFVAFGIELLAVVVIVAAIV